MKLADLGKLYFLEAEINVLRIKFDQHIHQLRKELRNRYRHGHPREIVRLLKKMAAHHTNVVSHHSRITLRMFSSRIGNPDFILGRVKVNYAAGLQTEGLIRRLFQKYPPK